MWLVAWSAPSHYLNQCWNIVNWTLRNKLQWNFNRSSNIVIQEMRLKVSSAKWRPFYLGLNVLILQHILWWKLDDETASVMRRYHMISNTTFIADWSPLAYSLFDSDMTMVTSADRNVLWNQRSSCWITITPKITSTFKITFQVSPSNPTRSPFVVLPGTQHLAIAASNCNSRRSLFDWAADESR